MKIVMRTGFVRVASSHGDRIYKSLDDLPETLRERARQTLDGPNADTILIADPEAYEWILEMGEGLPTEIQRARPPGTTKKPKPGRPRRRATEACLPACSGSSSRFF